MLKHSLGMRRLHNGEIGMMINPPVPHALDVRYSTYDEAFDAGVSLAEEGRWSLLDCTHIREVVEQMRAVPVDHDLSNGAEGDRLAARLAALVLTHGVDLDESDCDLLMSVGGYILRKGGAHG